MINILLAEDHGLTRLGLKAAFRRTNDICVIGEAVNGEEAIDKARLILPDVILMDVGMPVVDGIQAASVIIATNAAAKVIMLTQHDDEDNIMASLAAGASGYCLKDAEPRQLHAAVRAVHGGDIWLDSFIAALVLKLEGANVPKSSTNSSINNDALNEPLSSRELEILKFLVEGAPNHQIADKLTISLGTLKTCVSTILKKLSVDDRTQAAVQAMRQGLI